MLQHVPMLTNTKSGWLVWDMNEMLGYSGGGGGTRKGGHLRGLCWEPIGGMRGQGMLDDVETAVLKRNFDNVIYEAN
jgi:hypothetical protein